MQVEHLLAEVLGPDKLPPGIVDLVSRSKTGAVVFLVGSQITLVLPPFPVTGEDRHTDCTRPLRLLLQSDYRIGLVLVRLGAYAVGVSYGERLVTSKVGTGLVHARHRQGGSSQARFQRHREKQIEYFLTRVCGHVRDIFEPVARSLNFMVFGGAWTTILELRKHCSFLQQLDAPTLPPLLDIREPKKDVLQKTVGHVWVSQFFQWLIDEPQF